MRPLFILLALLALTTLPAQQDGADPAAIAHIREQCQLIENSSHNLEILSLDDGTEVTMLGENIRQIIRKTSTGASESYYYSAVGNPIFASLQFVSKEELFYFDPQLDEGPGRLGMIRWIEGKQQHKPDEKAFKETGKRVMSTAFDLLHRAQGELEFTAEIYSAIIIRLAQRDLKLAEQELIVIDTIDQLKAEEIAPEESNEPQNPCWDYLTNYSTEPGGPIVRTVRSHGCDASGIAYTTYEVITDYDQQKRKLRIADITNEFSMEAPDGKGLLKRGFSAQTTTYFDRGEPVYELLTSEHQGLEVFRRLSILEE